MTKPCCVAGAAAFQSIQCTEKEVLMPDMQEDIHDGRRLAAARCTTTPWLLSLQVSVLRERLLGYLQSKGPPSVTYRQQGVRMLPLSGGVQLWISLEETHEQVSSNPSMMMMLWPAPLLSN